MSVFQCGCDWVGVGCRGCVTWVACEWCFCVLHVCVVSYGALYVAWFSDVSRCDLVRWGGYLVVAMWCMLYGVVFGVGSDVVVGVGGDLFVGDCDSSGGCTGVGALVGWFCGVWCDGESVLWCAFLVASGVACACDGAFVGVAFGELYGSVGSGVGWCIAVGSIGSCELLALVVRS